MNWLPPMTEQQRHDVLADTSAVEVRGALTHLTQSVQDALDAAEFIHEGQRWGKQPYINHVARVSFRCLSWVDRENMDNTAKENLVIAALLHDSVEDAPEKVRSFFSSEETSLETLALIFSDDVSDIVRRVTFPDGDDHSYISHYLNHVTTCDSILVKGADLCENAGNLPNSKWGRKKARRYRSLLEFSLNEGMSSPYTKACSDIEKTLSHLDSISG